MATITETPGVHRIILYPESTFQFNHFLVVDDEPTFHTGAHVPGSARGRGGSSTATLRWIGFGHFEVDECGSLNEWLKVRASRPSQASSGPCEPQRLRRSPGACSRRRKPSSPASASVTDHAPPPHGWDAGVLFEETSNLPSATCSRTTATSALTESDVPDARESLRPPNRASWTTYFTPNTRRQARGAPPQTLAIMHAVRSGETARGTPRPRRRHEGHARRPRAPEPPSTDASRRVLSRAYPAQVDRSVITW